MGPCRRFALISVAGVASLLAACVPVTQPQSPPATQRPPALSTPPQVSASSKALTKYYANLQADLLAQGLLRTDGGGPDTAFSAATLAQNFETIAFFNEYTIGPLAARRDTTPGAVRRWGSPVRMSVQFGASVPEDQKQLDSTNVRLFAQRLNRVTQHPISLSENKANFHVLFMGADDTDELLAHVRRIVPNTNPTSLRILTNMSRSTHCLMLGYPASDNPSDIRRAIVVIRSEHPDIIRKSCIHEELSQGLGLANDSPTARPSIFNDDDEFAFLTTHDEMLLKMLYDPRLRLGMPLSIARPVFERMAAELTGGNS